MPPNESPSAERGISFTREIEIAVAAIQAIPEISERTRTRIVNAITGIEDLGVYHRDRDLTEGIPEEILDLQVPEDSFSSARARAAIENLHMRTGERITIRYLLRERGCLAGSRNFGAKSLPYITRFLAENGVPEDVIGEFRRITLSIMHKQYSRRW